MDLFHGVQRFITIIMMCGVDHPTVNGYLINVAVNKTTEQSGSSDNNIATSPLATDGNVDQEYSQGSCSTTGSVVRPYLEVDLGANYDIYYIKVFGRTDCCSERFRDLQFHVSRNNGVFTTFGIHSGQMPSVFESRPNYPKSGQIVRISKWGNENAYLTLCEVQVMVKSENERGRLRMRLVADVKGDSSAIKIWTKPSVLQCERECLLDQSCSSMNVIQVVTSYPDVECHLLRSLSKSSTSNSTVKYYEIY